MRVSIQVKGIKEALSALKNLQNNLEEPFREVIQGGAQLIRGEAIKSIQTGPKSGRIYEKYNPRRTHKSSAPGQAPASDTGNLVSQIRVMQKNPDELGVESRPIISGNFLKQPPILKRPLSACQTYERRHHNLASSGGPL